MGIKNPCIKVCTNHPKHDICTGCYRTFYERTNWMRMTPTEQYATHNLLILRKARLGDISIKPIPELPPPPVQDKLKLEHKDS